MSIKLQQQAIVLRKKGYLYSEIANKLGVSKSSAYLWTSSTVVSMRVKKLLDSKQHAARLNNVKRLALINVQRHEAQNAAIRAEAGKLVQSLTLSTDHKKLLCAILIWCEGGKAASEGVRFINSDSVMVRTFLDLFRSSFSIDESKFRALIQIHEYHNKGAQLRYWSKITNIPVSQFHKPYVKPHTGKSIHDGYQGCVSIRYQDNSLGKMLKMIYTEFGKM